MALVYLGLGANVGGRAEYLAKARTALKNIGELELESKIYETKPWGKADQPDFLNQCLSIETELKPEELLKAIKQIELKLGRKQRERWGPREIDIDILYYNKLIYSSGELTIPHKSIGERAFVLVPLAEIASDFIDPKNQKTIGELVALVDTHGVKLYELR